MIAAYCTGLQHIGIPTDDPMETEAFYQKLGFTTVYRTKTANGPVIFTQLNNLQLEIYQQEPVRAAGAIDHIAIDVTNIQACYDWAQENDMKIRASIGLLGNDAVSPYAFLSTYDLMDSNKNAYQTILNGKVMQALRASVIANPTLTWENTLTYNAGFDFTMWNGLLGVEFDAFYNYTYDILTAMGGDYPPSMGGYYYTYANYNKVDSKGVEVTVSHRNKFNLAGKPFSYGASFNLTFARNRYLRYPDSPNTVEWRKRTGRSVDASVVWIADGLFRSEEEIDNSAWYGTRPNVGDIKYKDLNGDGKIDEDDRTRVGRGNRPELTYGLNLNCAWNGFDLSAQFTGGALFDVSLTGTYYNGYDDNTVWTQAFKEGANSPLYLVQNAYTVENPNGTFPRLTLGNQGHGGDNGLASTFWLRCGRG